MKNVIQMQQKSKLLASWESEILELLGCMSKLKGTWILGTKYNSHDEMPNMLLVHARRHLKECFDHSIPVNRQLTRYKHWFQDEHIVDNRVTNGTLVLAMFRNPFEWVEAMRARVSDRFCPWNLEGFLCPKPYFLAATPCIRAHSFGLGRICDQTLDDGACRI